jgi:DNA-binding protein H-NS
MSDSVFEAMSLDDLWSLREDITSALVSKLEAQTQELENRLAELAQNFRGSVDNNPQRRPYPKVQPKFQNPQQPSETWSGRGKRPRWASRVLEAGGSLDDLRILETARTIPYSD